MDIKLIFIMNSEAICLKLASQHYGEELMQEIIVQCN